MNNNSNNNQSSSVSNVTTKTIPISLLQSELNYIQNAKQLGSIEMLPDHIKQRNLVALQQSSDNTNASEQRVATTANLINKKKINTSNSNLESVKRSSPSSSSKPFMSLKSTRIKDMNENNQNSVNMRGVLPMGIQRQNTMNTIIQRENSNDVIRHNSNSTIGNYFFAEFIGHTFF